MKIISTAEIKIHNISLYYSSFLSGYFFLLSLVLLDTLANHLENNLSLNLENSSIFDKDSTLPILINNTI